MSAAFSSLNLVMLGPPGSGKTTQAQKLAASYDLAHVATGEMLRDEVKRETVAGSQAQDSFNRGNLVSDRVVAAMILERLDRADCQRGFILDGYPRTVDQAVLLDGILAELGRAIERVVLIALPQSESLLRLVDAEPAGRSEADQVVRERLRVWEQNAPELTAFYRNRGLLVEVDGNAPDEEVAEAVTRAVDAPVGA